MIANLQTIPKTLADRNGGFHHDLTDINAHGLQPKLKYSRKNDKFLYFHKGNN